MTNEYQTVPPFLCPVGGSADFMNMKDGGRNSALFPHILKLQEAGLAKEECRETIRLINTHVLAEPLSDDEIETITRDEAFKAELGYFGKGGVFLQDRLGEAVKGKLHVIRLDGPLHAYRDGIYVLGHREIKSETRKLLPNIRIPQQREVLGYIEDTAPVAHHAEPELIAFKNGVLDIRTGDLSPHSPSYVLTNAIHADYDPSAYHPLADATLDKITCHDGAIRALLEEAIGYGFFRSARLGKAFILTGRGANGKSTFLTILRCLLGSENVSALDLANLGDRFARAELHGKLANIGDDISDEFIADASLFKKITTGDAIQAEHKGQPMFMYQPYATLYFSANSMPRIKDRTGAVLRRLAIIPFDAKFTRDDEDYDPDIVAKLTSPEALTYFARLGVEGLRRALANKGFTQPQRVTRELEEFETFNQPIRGFVSEVGMDYILTDSCREIYLAYASYCRDNGYHAESANRFGRTMRDLFGVESYPGKVNGRGVRFYRAISD